MNSNTNSWGTEQELLELLRNQLEESAGLEYKAPEALAKSDTAKKEIAKDVSAFANSAGGTIIYGVIEENKRFPSDLRGVDSAYISKEWLEHVIAGNIQPRPSVRIVPIELKQKDPGKYAYVVQVPQGETAHQSLPHRQYFKRHEFESVPMNDYEIRDVMNRKKHPILDPTFRYFWLGGGQAGEHTYRLEIMLRNSGPVRALNWKLAYRLPEAVVKEMPSGIPYSKTLEKEERYVDSYILGEQPIFPDDQTTLFKFPILNMSVENRKRIEGHQLCLFWTMYADDMPARKGKVLLDEIEAVVP